MKTPDDRLKYFDDDGNEVNPDLISKSSLCVSCVKVEDPKEEMRCNLNCLDQQSEEDFECFAYESK
ncbi:MAG: hypothetical protein MRK01_04755 [Candidatus Scalindua sp.]|nr:hypothetical protein [Candidatus Scalindua sp.]